MIGQSKLLIVKLRKVKRILDLHHALLEELRTQTTPISQQQAVRAANCLTEYNGVDQA